eukprot:CAMPEP_0113529464 /NCGR_PEP_ID=MMETSP0015_2-20120614/2409_1 /TAXON_ID=2838 /ORGANISM="Odontella" /LENGTH=182 /DNA_ID=CAMNT_0000428099 /DNA_START=158 /DNA_END=706 /DNA_ORIENTATION=- /assembly_acc=CAM_ASM_000160
MVGLQIPCCITQGEVTSNTLNLHFEGVRIHARCTQKGTGGGSEVELFSTWLRDAYGIRWDATSRAWVGDYHQHARDNPDEALLFAHVIEGVLGWETIPGVKPFVARPKWSGTRRSSFNLRRNEGCAGDGNTGPPRSPMMKRLKSAFRVNSRAEVQGSSVDPSRSTAAGHTSKDSPPQRRTSA